MYGAISPFLPLVFMAGTEAILPLFVDAKLI